VFAAEVAYLAYEERFFTLPKLIERRTYVWRNTHRQNKIHVFRKLNSLIQKWKLETRPQQWSIFNDNIYRQAQQLDGATPAGTKLYSRTSRIVF